jgi:predicted alpha/beta hydrolase
VAAARLARRALVLTFADDAFAPRAGADRFLAYTPGLAVTHRILRPVDAGLDRIGHFGFFRASAENTLWPPVLAYLLHESPGGPAT